MTILTDLQPASFNEVSFLFIDEMKEGGKKIVTHEYPFSDRRFTEELGELPPIFRMQAIIHGSMQDRFDFETALTRPGLGKLVHPVYGDIEVKSTTYSVNSSQASIGEFRFSVTFEASEKNITTSPISQTREDTSQDADDSRSSLESAMKNIYRDPKTSFEVTRSRNKLIALVGDLQGLIDTVASPDAAKKVLFNRQINKMIASAGNYVQDADQLALELSICFDRALDIVESPDQLLEQWTQGLGFGYLLNPSKYFGYFTYDRGISVGETNTIKRKNAEINRQLMNEYFRMQALVNLYEATAYKDFRTAVELNETMDALSTAYRLQFQDSYEVSMDIPRASNDQDVRDRMLVLRSNALSTYAGKLQNAWHVVDIYPGVSSIALTTYRYYGDLGNLDLISNLNKDNKVSYLDNGIKAVAK